MASRKQYIKWSTREWGVASLMFLLTYGLLNFSAWRSAGLTPFDGVLFGIAAGTFALMFCALSDALPVALACAGALLAVVFGYTFTPVTPGAGATLLLLTLCSCILLLRLPQWLILVCAIGAFFGIQAFTAMVGFLTCWGIGAAIAQADRPSLVEATLGRQPVFRGLPWLTLSFLLMVLAFFVVLPMAVFSFGSWSLNQIVWDGPKQPLLHVVTGPLTLNQPAFLGAVLLVGAVALAGGLIADLKRVLWVLVISLVAVLLFAWVPASGSTQFVGAAAGNLAIFLALMTIITLTGSIYCLFQNRWGQVSAVALMAVWAAVLIIIR